MPHTPALDGIRAIAILLVMVFHSQAPFLRGGFLGVDIFFVLSGFLITTLLQHDIARSGRIDLRRFYARRLKRLTPPLAFALLLYLAIAPHAWPDYEGHGQDALLAAAYLSDYSRALWGVPEMLRHTWSLAVEMHFYLLWPLVLLLLQRLGARNQRQVLLALYVAATVWRFACLESQGWEMSYYRFDTRLSGLLIGALTAVLLATGKRIEAGKAAAALSMILCLTVYYFGWHARVALTFGTVVAELATAAVIIMVMQGRQVRLLAMPALAYAGRLSYGVYLFHFPLMLYLREQYNWQTALLGGGAAALLLAALSYHTVEALFRSQNRLDLVRL